MQSTRFKRYQQLQPEGCVISRELRRNAQPVSYASTSASACVQRRRLQSRPLGRLHRDGILFGLMRQYLSKD